MDAIYKNKEARNLGYKEIKKIEKQRFGVTEIIKQNTGLKFNVYSIKNKNRKEDIFISNVK